MWRVTSTTVHPIVNSATGNMQVKCVNHPKDLGIDMLLVVAQKTDIIDNLHVIFYFKLDFFRIDFCGGGGGGGGRLIHFLTF